jgi:hypothetical protein
MILNGKTQLGLAFDRYMQDEVFGIHYDKYLANETDLEKKAFGTLQIKDLFSDYKNHNYVFRQTAIDMASRIKLDKGKFEDLTFLTDKLPAKKCTFLMGRDKLYRWLRWDDTSDIMVICIKMVPPDEEHREHIEKMDKVLDLPKEELIKMFDKKKADGTITPFEYNYVKSALETKDFKNHAKKGIFYYLWGIKDGKLFFPPDERNEDFYSEMMEFTKLLIFTELIDVETVELGPKQSHGTRKQGKYLNETNKFVKVVDSSWNKILIKGQEFPVSAHIRLQPYGPGLKYRKPIVIEEFKKEGYTRSALKEA